MIQKEPGSSRFNAITTRSPHSHAGSLVSVLDLDNAAFPHPRVMNRYSDPSATLFLSLFTMSIRPVGRSNAGQPALDDQTIKRFWWSLSGSNRRPSACKADALPAELRPRRDMVGRGGLEPPTSRLSGVRSNHLSYRPADRYRQCRHVAFQRKDTRREPPRPKGPRSAQRGLTRILLFSIKLKRYEDGLVRDAIL